MARKKQVKVQKTASNSDRGEEIFMYETDGSFRMTDAYIERLEKIELMFPHIDMAPSYCRRPEEAKRDIGSGAWIMIIKETEVSRFSMQPGNIYYAIPGLYGSSVGYRADGMYLVKVKIADFSGFEEIYLYPYEYMLVSDELFEAAKEEDLLELVQYKDDISEPEVIHEKTLTWRDKYKDLPEDERNVLDAYMLDGLSFDQACSAYYTERFIDQKGYSYWYRAKPELRYMFGR